MRLGVVTGLVAEARIAWPLGRVEVGGGTAAGARDAAERLDDVDALISFGLAGGLDPSLQAGALAIPACVVNANGERYIADPDLTARLGGPTIVAMAAGAAVAATVDTKAALYVRTGACAIDLESGAVAEVARRRGLRWAVLRAICDPATRDLPPAALVALDAHGAIGGARVFTSVLRRPSQLRALLALAADAAAARRSLRRAAKTATLR